jgi:hypothetical protein
MLWEGLDRLKPLIPSGPLTICFLEAVTSVFEGWAESIFEIERVIARGDDVIALGQLRTRGRATGIAATSPHGEIWTFDAGKVAR